MLTVTATASPACAGTTSPTADSVAVPARLLAACSGDVGQAAAVFAAVDLLRGRPHGRGLGA